MRHIAVIAALALALTLATPALADSARFALCGAGKRVTCIVDGDTLWLRGEKIRLVGFDAPEMGQPRCDRPARLARPSRDRLRQLLDGASFALERHGRDKFGRTLAVIRIGGEDIAGDMIAAGLGRVYLPGAGPWC